MVKVIRDGKEKTFNVKLGELPVKTLSKGGRPGISPDSKSDLLEGVELTDLDSRTRQQFSIPENIRGALVTEVNPGSPAAKAGLEQGDVIVEINRKPVTKADEAIELSQGPAGDRSCSGCGAKAPLAMSWLIPDDRERAAKNKAGAGNYLGRY